MIGVPVICAPDSERAEWLSRPSAISFVKLRQGQPTQLPSPEDAATYEMTPMEHEIVRTWHAPLVLGDPATVRYELEQLAARTGVDELMVTTMVHGHDDRLTSYRLLAEEWGLRPRAVAAA